MPSSKERVGNSILADNAKIRSLRRIKSLEVPIEEQWHLPQKTKRQSSLVRIGINAMKQFRYPTKKNGRSKSLQMIFEGVHDPNDESLVEDFLTLLKLGGHLSDKHDDYHTLLRFLRMREFDMQKARVMYLKMLQWRKENRVDSIEEEFSLEEYNEVKKYYPHGYHGVDRYGRPLYIDRIGMIDLDALLKVTTVERLVKNHILEQERTLRWRYPACSLAAKKHVASTTAILDVRGVGKSSLSRPARDIFTEIQRIDSNYYPETLNQLFIVNAGSGFRVLWKVLKGSLEAQTVAKIHVLGTDYKTTLLEFIEPSNLPTFLNGTCICSKHGGCLLEDTGPWTSTTITDMLQAMFETGQQFSGGSTNSFVTEGTKQPMMDDEPVIGIHNTGSTKGPELHQHKIGVMEYLPQKILAWETTHVHMQNLLLRILAKQENLERQMNQLKDLSTTIESYLSGNAPTTCKG